MLLITSHTYDAEISGTNLQTRNKPVKVPADIKGLKIRTASTPVEISLMKAYGANPTPVDWGQLYSAAVSFRMNLLPIYINQKKFESLTPSQQKALLDAAAQVKTVTGQWARDR